LHFVAKHLHQLQVVLMMTVQPGFGGQVYLEHAVPKIMEARKLPQDEGAVADLEVDGGIKLSNLDRTVATGASIVVAGSAIFDGVDAPAAARSLRSSLDELGGRR
jgi:ribulose-phosphate 3-epimerase